jgi:hypothetical protein
MRITTTILEKNKKDPKILPEGSAKLRLARRGVGDIIFHSLCGPVERKETHDSGGPSSSLKESFFFPGKPIMGAARVR